MPELAQRKAENLYNRIKEIHAERKLIRWPPGLKRVAAWISQARELLSHPGELYQGSKK